MCQLKWQCDAAVSHLRRAPVLARDIAAPEPSASAVAASLHLHVTLICSTVALPNIIADLARRSSSAGVELGKCTCDGDAA